MDLRLQPLLLAAFLAAACAAPAPVQLPASARLTWWQYANWRRHWCTRGGRLVCHFTPTAGSNVTGTAIFSPRWTGAACAVQLYARVRNLPPSRSCAIHIHTWGDTTRSDGKSLGGHFASPAMQDLPHGLPTDPQRHWGDFGSLAADANGYAVYYRVDHRITLAGIVGRGMVIHRDRDKGADSQPSGGAGPRKAMCVIGYANPATVA